MDAGAGCGLVHGHCLDAALMQCRDTVSDAVPDVLLDAGAGMRSLDRSSTDGAMQPLDVIFWMQCVCVCADAIY